MVYEKTHMEYDETAGCCGGVGSGGAFVDVKKYVSITLNVATAEQARVEMNEKWEKLRAKIKKNNVPGYCYETKEQTWEREASNPRLVYKLRPRSAKERAALQKEDEEESDEKN